MAIVGGGLPGLLTAVAVRHACPGARVKAISFLLFTFHELFSLRSSTIRKQIVTSAKG